jgi:hypothetical protein
MMRDVREILANARASGDPRLQILATRELRPLIDLWSKMREKAKSGDSQRAQIGLEILSRLPTEFVRRLRDGDPETLQAVLRALPVPQEGVIDAEAIEVV